MYDRAVTKIRSSVGVTEEIPVQVGLHQGSALSPYLFDLIMDILTEDVRKRAPWCMMFADDVVLCEQSAEDLEIELEKWKNALEERGVRINRPKTVQLNFGMDEGQRVHLDGEELNVVDKFKYLGSMIDKEGELDLVRPAMMYGAETWAMNKIHENRLEVAEMRMLRWSCGVTRMDRIRNEVIRIKIKVTEMSKKIQERRLQWYGHVEKRDESYVHREKSRENGSKREKRARETKEKLEELCESGSA
ncbi:hypothetical protein WDU94_007671 [Cyamophila willieti]